MKPPATIEVTKDRQTWTILTDAVIGYGKPVGITINLYVIGLGSCTTTLPTHLTFADWLKQNFPQFVGE